MSKGESHRFYTSKEWRSLRAIILMNNPLCKHCEANGMLVPATEIDHIQPIKKAPHLRLDYDNLQPLCHSCHSRKSMNENRDKYKRGKEKPDRDRLADKLKGLIS